MQTAGLLYRTHVEEGLLLSSFVEECAKYRGITEILIPYVF